MAITATQVNDLRNMTGAGMMDCKKALTEAEGDFEKAVEILRKKGQKVSAARADRDAKEGAVFSYSNEAGTEALLIELNCETDFVARNEDFQHMGNSIVQAVFESGASDLEAVAAVQVNGTTVAELLTQAMGRIGEKISVSKISRLKADKVVIYIHPGAKVGVLVAFKGITTDITVMGKDVAMQIAAMKPVALDKDDVPVDIVNKEIEIGKEQARAEGKPEAILEKIALGKLNKFYAENTLLNQEFVKDTSKTIRQFIKEHDPGASVAAFSRLQLGA